jgi:DNA-binding response OmpR family regulator
MLTGRTDAVDRVVGLELGADDYLGKPFVLREVLARLRAIQRRQDYGAALSAQRQGPDPQALKSPLPSRIAAPQMSPARPSPPRATRPKPAPVSPLRIGKLEIDLKGQELRDEAGTPIKLTHTEFNILILLASAAGQVVSRDRLMQEVAGRGWDPNDRSIDVHVSNLRRKLEVGSAQPNLIRAVRGTGYMLVDAED